ncbi:MAG: SRPBCC family protein [Burkholderiales bacterium]|nr:MAG: SRPBCC family protein [Burkholderiales bacterium]
MEVKLEKRYPIPVESDRAWQVLRDVKAVAGCMPGASITEQLDESRYKGAVKVKVGPATANFGGEIEVLQLDEAARQVRLRGKGADRGGSSATLDLQAVIEAAENPAESVLVGNADVIVNGKFAQFGGRMMMQVSDMILGQFADNFRSAAAALPAPGVAAEAGIGAAPSGPEAAAAPPVPPAREINALAILWSLIKGWFAGLFGKRG